jgi:DNA processing protein
MDIDVVLLAAAYLHIPARRVRALARDQDRDLKEWIVGDTSRKVAHARHQAKEGLSRLHHLHAKLVPIGSESYPGGLLDLDEPPAFLCVRGTIPADGIAIIGSRTPSPEATAFAHDLAAACDVPVVSGLARGIDAAAHKGAIGSGHPTIAYVATGLGATYPPEHRSLEDEIVERGGAIATERLPDEEVTKSSLLHRDRLQAAHARATVLIASELDGGAMYTMRFAKELGRARFALNANNEAGYAGNAQTIAEGALPIPFDVHAALKKIRKAFIEHATK